MGFLMSLHRLAPPPRLRLLRPNPRIFVAQNDLRLQKEVGRRSLGTKIKENSLKIVQYPATADSSQKVESGSRCLPHTTPPGICPPPSGTAFFTGCVACLWPRG